MSDTERNELGGEGTKFKVLGQECNWPFPGVTWSWERSEGERKERGWEDPGTRCWTKGRSLYFMLNANGSKGTDLWICWAATNTGSRNVRPLPQVDTSSVTMSSAHLLSEQSLTDNGGNQGILHQLRPRGKAEQPSNCGTMPLTCTHTFSFNPKGTLKACLLSSDVQCPCQLVNQEQEPWPCQSVESILHMSTESPGRVAAHSIPRKQQAYLCRWSHSPHSPVCRCSYVLGQCWCRWHSHHSCAAHCHIHHALYTEG